MHYQSQPVKIQLWQKNKNTIEAKVSKQREKKKGKQQM